MVTITFPNREKLKFYDLKNNRTNTWAPSVEFYKPTGEFGGSTHFHKSYGSWEEYAISPWDKTELAKLNAGNSPNTELIVECLIYLQDVDLGKIDPSKTPPLFPKDSTIEGWPIK